MPHTPAPPAHHAHWPLPWDTRSASHARRLVALALTDWGATDHIDDITLIVTELVGNAARYGRPDVQLSLTVTDRELRVEVADGGEWTIPTPRPAIDDMPIGSRGLPLVARLSGCWGIDTDSGGGKRVWCTRPLAARSCTECSALIVPLIGGLWVDMLACPQCPDGADHTPHLMATAATSPAPAGATP